MSENYFHDALMCAVKAIHYDFEEKTGYVFMPPRNHVNMSTCIKLFKYIDSRVQRILTFAGEQSDTAYVLKNDEWLAGSVANVIVDYAVTLHKKPA
jgi:hypothetical protein